MFEIMLILQSLMPTKGNAEKLSFRCDKEPLVIPFFTNY